jgi:hypothetical protein
VTGLPEDGCARTRTTDLDGVIDGLTSLRALDEGVPRTGVTRRGGR